MAEQNNKATRAKRLNEQILLEYLKEKFESAVGHKMICAKNDDKISEKKRPYYFEKLECNILPEGMKKAAKEAYKKGDGQEFNLKMRALRSSSAMTFNIFGNGDEKGFIDHSHDFLQGKYQLIYEKQLSTINSAKANIDVCLISENGEDLILFEMKMAEWLLGQPKKLRESYLEADNKYSEIRKLAEKFVNMNIRYKENGKVVHPAITHYFDVVQMILHLWGLYNTVIVQKKEFIGVKKITLVCGMWTIENREFKQFDKYKEIEEAASEEFKEFYGKLVEIKKKFKDEHIDLEVKKMSVKEIIECLKKSNEEMKYLQRYL